MDEPGAWGRRVVVNRSVSRIRRRAAETRALVRVRGRAERSDRQLVDPADADLWREVRRLPPRQAQAIALRYLRDLEVALVVRHRLAPLAAFAGGASLAVGYVAVHFLPGRSWLSDSFTSAVDVSPLSWTAATAEALASTALGIVGLVVLQARGGLESAAQEHPTQHPPRATLLHPGSVVMIVGNVLVLGIPPSTSCSGRR